jgi:hypothetical protein
MNYRDSTFNFEEIHLEAKTTLFGKLVLIGLVVTFLVVPLSTISPETFVVPDSAIDSYVMRCGCFGCD